MHIYSGILLSHKEQNDVTEDATEEYHVKQIQSDSKGKFHMSICVLFCLLIKCLHL